MTKLNKVEFLKQNLPYKKEWYKRLNDKQITAIYLKTVAKNQEPKKKEGPKVKQLSLFDMDGYKK